MTISTLKEMDAAVAEHCMGWQPNARDPRLHGDGWWDCGGSGGSEFLNGDFLPEFSTDPTACYALKEAMRAKEWSGQCCSSPSNPFWATFWKADDDDKMLASIRNGKSGPTEAIAVGKAALATVPCPDCDTGFPEGLQCRTCHGSARLEIEYAGELL